MDIALKAIGIFVLALVIIFGVAIVFAYPTMLLFNYVFSSTALLAVFGVAKMTFWRTFWTGILFGLLFGRQYTKS